MSLNVVNTTKTDLGDRTPLERGDVTGYDDILTATAAASAYVAQAASPLYAQTATLAVTDTTAKDLFTLPAGAIVLAFIVDIETEFDDGVSNVIDLGDDSTADRFAADVDCGSGTAGATLVGSADKTALSADTVVQGVYTPGTSASNGAAQITALYLQPGS